MEDFKDKEVLECGCGGGQHTSFIAPYAKHITAVDLNTTAIARERNKGKANIEFIEADIMTMDLNKQFDIVFSIGVIHHTDIGKFRGPLNNFFDGFFLVISRNNNEGFTGLCYWQRFLL